MGGQKRKDDLDNKWCKLDSHMVWARYPYGKDKNKKANTSYLHKYIFQVHCSSKCDRKNKMFLIENIEITSCPQDRESLLK